MRRTVALLLCALLLVILAGCGGGGGSTIVTSPTSYTVHKLASFNDSGIYTGASINNQGIVLIIEELNNLDVNAVLLNPDGSTLREYMVNGSRQGWDLATGLNDSNWAIFMAASDGFRWASGTAPTRLPTEFYSMCQPYDINNSGQVVGTLLEESMFGDSRRALSWDTAGNDEILPLPDGYTYSAAYGVNDTGYIVGEVSKNREGPYTAVLWTPSRQIVFLQKSKSVYSSSFRINNTGRVLGRAGSQYQIWDMTGELKTSLRAPLGHPYIYPHGFNDNAQVVGFASDTLEDQPNVQAIVWSSSGIPHSLSPFAGDEMARAYDINNLGQIVGKSYGNSSQETNVVVWTPN